MHIYIYTHIIILFYMIYTCIYIYIYDHTILYDIHTVSMGLLISSWYPQSMTTIYCSASDGPGGTTSAFRAFAEADHGHDPGNYQPVADGSFPLPGSFPGDQCVNVSITNGYQWLLYVHFVEVCKMDGEGFLNWGYSNNVSRVGHSSIETIFFWRSILRNKHIVILEKIDFGKY